MRPSGRRDNPTAQQPAAFGTVDADEPKVDVPATPPADSYRVNVQIHPRKTG
jgi:hypothetical protein